MEIRYFEIEDCTGQLLTVATRADDDEMECCFVAVCMDTGEPIQINGWLIDRQELLALSDAISDRGEATMLSLGWIDAPYPPARYAA